MNLTNFDEARQYFRDIATKHIHINSYHFGDAERLQAQVRSALKLPVLWQEPYLPVTVQDPLSDNHTGLVTQTIAIYTKAGSDKYEDQEEAYKLCETIIKDIIGRMINDNHTGLITHELQGFRYGEAEDLMGATRLIGCRLDIQYFRPERLIYDMNKWQ